MPQQRYYAWRSILLSVVFTACLGPGADLSPGDVAPGAMRSGGRLTVALVARVGDCLSCDLRGIFTAVRALQRSDLGTHMPELVVVAVTQESRDTLAFRRTLKIERVMGRIERVSLRTAKGFLDENKLPAMYLIEDEQVLREWERTPERGTVMIGRNELLDAVAQFAGW